MPVLQNTLDNVLNQYAVCDAIVVVDYPNWVNAAHYLRIQYGFKFVTDYMNDFTGILDNISTQLKDNCMNDTDTLVSKEQLVEFGLQNDWWRRYEAFAEGAFSIVPKVSVITITYNNLDYNKAFLDSILTKTAYANYEVIIVDNLSTDGTREWLQEVKELNDPRIKVILNDKNSGFAGGNNIGIRAADGDYILLLNNDTLVTRGWMTAMVKHAENDPEVGMVGAVTNSIGNEAMVPCKYTNMEELDWFSYRYTRKHINERYEDVRMLAMFAVLFSRKVLNICGELDERYGLGMFEDDDYSLAIQKQGLKLVIAEDAFIHHFQSLSFSKMEDEQYQKTFQKNKSLFEQKWCVEWNVPKYREGVNNETNMNVKVKL